ncbi:hypothetical protein, partial [Nocardia fluminea]|uniref:hypothetical protein n=1 Tax=Nocardia fluminea TaxID=134984 RepID=UPI003435FFCA
MRPLQLACHQLDRDVQRVHGDVLMRAAVEGLTDPHTRASALFKAESRTDRDQRHYSPLLASATTRGF